MDVNAAVVALDIQKTFMPTKVEHKWIGRWFIAFRISGFLDFAHRPELYKLDLFPF
jgi:hypothetical protein